MVIPWKDASASTTEDVVAEIGHDVSEEVRYIIIPGWYKRILNYLYITLVVGTCR